MQAYQLGIAKFADAEAQVFGISTDNTPSQKEFATKVEASFPLLSDFKDRSVSEKYGVLIKEVGVANRVTFVIDKEGKIIHMEAGADAISTLGAVDACSRSAHKKGSN
jgi:peroxiredoxin